MSPTHAALCVGEAQGYSDLQGPYLTSFGVPSSIPDLHRWAVFLLLQLGEHIQDTETVVVDRTLTDISFQSNVLL